jgi:hypothetical protein
MLVVATPHKQIINQEREHLSDLLSPAICAQSASRLKRGIARLDTQPNINGC